MGQRRHFWAGAPHGSHLPLHDAVRVLLADRIDQTMGTLLTDTPRYAVFGDVHANLTALDAVLADIDRHGRFDAIISNGDQLAGGPRPLEVWDRLQARGAMMLVGNTERDLLRGDVPPPPWGLAKRGMLKAVFFFCRDLLSEELVETAAGLPFAIRIRANPGSPVLMIAHANASNVDDFLTPTTSPRVFNRLLGRENRPQMLITGHIHSPQDAMIGGVRVVRPGSVGLKYERDVQHLANWLEVWFDRERNAWAFNLHQVEWDNEIEIEVGSRLDYPGVTILPGFWRFE